MMPSSQCDHQRIDQFFLGEFVGADPMLSEHLETCDDCRKYFDRCAASDEQWDAAHRLLQPHDFDVATSAEFAAGGTTADLSFQSDAIQEVQNSLAPTDDPHRLGRIGDYEVSGVVGVGGMGVVLKAIDPSLDRVVAIKVLNPRLANHEKARKRFAREARAAAAVIHPNVIPIHSVSGEGSSPYLVMAYVRGGSLQKRLDQDGPLEVVEVLRIGSQIAAGLAAAHGQGLVHRDIKPENVLLEGGVERVAITDFGLARSVDDNSVTQHGTIAGTPMYMSPEQARGEQVDQRSDLFSLGSVLYAMSTGVAPYRDYSSYGVMRRIIDDQPTPPRQLNPDIPEWLARIIETLMAKEKSQRFGSATEVHTLLEACLGHVQKPDAVDVPEGIEALSPSTATNQRLASPTTATSTANRTKIAQWATVLVGLALIGCVSAFLIFSDQWKEPTTSTTSDMDPDVERFVGTWEVVEYEDAGLSAPPDLINVMRFLFTEEAVTQLAGAYVRAGTYRINSQSSPKQIDILSDERSEHGIYEFNDDTLRIYLTELRPGESALSFDSNRNASNEIRITLKRVVKSSLVAQSSIDAGPVEMQFDLLEHPLVIRSAINRLTFDELPSALHLNEDPVAWVQDHLNITMDPLNKQVVISIESPQESRIKLQNLSDRLSEAYRATMKVLNETKLDTENDRIGDGQPSNEIHETELAAIEVYLQGRSIVMSPAGIQDYLRAVIEPTDDWSEAERLIAQLSSRSYTERQAAEMELRSLPKIPITLLRKAAESSDAERAYRARSILEDAISKQKGTIAQVFRAIELLKIAGLTSEILAVAGSYSEDDEIMKAATQTVKAVVSKADILQLSSLMTPESAEPLQELAAVALRNLEDVELADQYATWTGDLRLTESTRVETALALADLGDRRSLPLLLTLMVEAESVTVRSESLIALRKVTGQTINYSAYDEEAARRTQASAWKTWMNDNGDTAKLNFPLRNISSSNSNLNGNTLLALNSAGKVIEYDQDMNVIWIYESAYPLCAEKLANGNYLISEYHRRRVIEVTPDKEIVREHSVTRPGSVQMLANGNILVTSTVENGKVLEIDSEGNTVWEIESQERWFQDAIRLPNGNTLVSEISQRDWRIIEFDPLGEKVWELTGLPSIDTIQSLENGNVLVSFLVDSAVEYDRATLEEVWRLSWEGLRAAYRLENGNTLLMTDKRLSEVDRDGEEVDSIEITTTSGSIRR